MKNLIKTMVVIVSLIIFISCNTNNKSIDKEKEIIKKEVQLPNKSKIELFNNVNKLESVLSENGIGNVGTWRRDAFGWISGTDYFSFGEHSIKNGMQNNIAYYLESDQECCVEKLKIMLNINNENEKQQGLAKLKKVVQKTFESLNLDVPNGLLSNVSNGKEFQANNEFFTTILELDKSKIDTWKLTIISKT